jgi:hypothetical protein
MKLTWQEVNKNILMYMVSSYQKFIATLTYEHISKILIQIDVLKIFFIWVQIVLVFKICNPETLISIIKTHSLKEKENNYWS